MKDVVNARTTVFLQNACLQHRYIRSRDTSCIVERPERLRAVHVGLAAAVARIEESTREVCDFATEREPLHAAALCADIPNNDAEALALALAQMNLASTSTQVPVEFIHSSTSVDLLNHEAVKFVHGDIQGDVYLENLHRWATDSRAKIEQGESEIPEPLSQGDLYLCPESLLAIQGALGTVCEAVDAVVGSNIPSASNASKPQAARAFVAIRPPGHHCGEDTPSGFCFVNNVAVAAAHAHLRHGINRIVVLDIDLHHGNGTQSIVWQINEESYRQALEEEAGAPSRKPRLRVYYGSIHDVLSYPCEDGKPELVQAASVSIHGPHGQHIENIHLKPYSSEQQFWDELYTGLYSRILATAGDFLESTGGPGDDVLVFISCGFDASEHEYPTMSRHQRHVPTAFYHRFARDARLFADRYAHGRLISILEGGYSDRALTSGAMAHLSGLVEVKGLEVDEGWWALDNLQELEKATKQRRGGRISQPTASSPWLARAVEIFASIDSSHLVPSTGSGRHIVPPSSSRVLRERKTPAALDDAGSSTLLKEPAVMKKPKAQRGHQAAVKQEPPDADALHGDSDSASTSSIFSTSGIPEEGQVPKKQPRVILHLGPRPSESATK